jgi:hypothetical protein
MNLEEFILLIFIIGLFSIPLLIWCSVIKEGKRFRNLAKEIKPGDLYKREVRWLDDPFAEPVITYARIEEIKFNENNEPWVKYSIADVGFVKFHSRELRRFLLDFKLVEKKEQEVADE